MAGAKSIKRLRSIGVLGILVSGVVAAPARAQQGQLGIGMGTGSIFGVRSHVGRHVTLVCPAMSQAELGQSEVWGTDLYSDSSTLCAAAVHAGVLPAGKVGLVTIVMGSGTDALVGTTRNGVTTKSYGPYAYSFVFDRSGEPGTVDWVTTAQGIPAGFDQLVTVVCPSGGSMSYPVYGTDTYSDSSSICFAAVHAGVIPLATGGPVTVRMVGGVSSLAGTDRNGVKSIAFGEWPRNFQVSSPSGIAVKAPASPGTVAGPIAPKPGVAPPAPPPPTPVDAVPVSTTTTGTITPMPAPGGSPAPPVGGSPAPTNSGRYRVTLIGLLMSQTTKDIVSNSDGRGDELYGAAISILWNRTDGTVISKGAVRTVEYGDVGALTKSPDRIAAGNAGPTGGISTSGGIAPVPDGFDPNAASFPAPRTDRFPLLVWEGDLTDGVEALLVVPSIWERDVASTSFSTYRDATWLQPSPQSVLTSPVVRDLLAASSLTSAVATVQPGLPTLFTLSDLMANLIDRPLGLTPMPLTEPYHDRFVVVNREKLTSLQAGAAITIAIPYAEPTGDPVLGGNATLYLRVERLQ